MSTSTSAPSPSSRTMGGVPGPVLVGGAFVLTTVANICFQLGDIVFTDKDPHRPEGPIESMQGIALFGVIGLVVALAIAVPLVGDPARARVGAVVLGALSIITLPVFWSGAPATFGAAAAWLAGLGRGGRPQTGVARGFGIVGLVIAILEVVAVFAGPIASSLSGSA